MTPEEMDNMPAGREMDALVAEKVMGWKWFIGVANLGAGPKYRYLDEPNVWNPPRVEWDGKTEMAARGLYDDESHLPCYSTAISHAWQVVEKLLADDIQLNLAHDGDTWTVGEKYWNGEWDNPAYGETAPLAIARAALKAVTQEE